MKAKHTHNPNTTENNTKTKWETFTYVGPDTRILTKLFRNTHLKIAYKTTNTLQHNLK
jgi:hypothetical protein